VVAGLLIGNHGRQFAMSDKTPEHLHTFWELIGQVRLFLLPMTYALVVFAMSGVGADVWHSGKNTDCNSIFRGYFFISHGNARWFFV